MMTLHKVFLDFTCQNGLFWGKGFTFAPTNKKPFNINNLGMTIMQNFTIRDLLAAIGGVCALFLVLIFMLSIGGF
jgi:hypothetical protein